jgi:hypothetical protein
MVEALGGAAEGSYEQEAAAAEEDEEMEREDERGVGGGLIFNMAHGTCAAAPRLVPLPGPAA